MTDFFDLSGNFNKFGPQRIGDRAAIHIKLLEFKLLNPDKKLIVVDDWEFAKWLFWDIADEIVSSDAFVDNGYEDLYTKPLWLEWKDKNRFLRNRVSIRPKMDSSVFWRNLREKWGIYGKYICFHPYFDAEYAFHRNMNPAYCYNIINKLSRNYPVVVVGRPSLLNMMPCPPHAYPICALNMSIMDTFAVIADSQVFVGGETGLSIWSGVLGRNVVGLYPQVAYEDGWFSEPQAFGVGNVLMDRSAEEDSAIKKIVWMFEEG